MRFDHWTKEQKTKLKADYKQLFGEQINAIKKLFKTKGDPILCSELLDNIASKLFLVMQEQNLVQTEALIENMFLSNLRYDVYIFKEKNFCNYRFDLTFYNNHKTYDINKITVKDITDLQQVLKLIMYIGKQYDKYLKLDNEFELIFDEYTFMHGFENIVKENKKRVTN